jgi:hypothetical protein
MNKRNVVVANEDGEKHKINGRKVKRYEIGALLNRQS